MLADKEDIIASEECIDYRSKAPFPTPAQMIDDNLCTEKWVGICLFRLTTVIDKKTLIRFSSEPTTSSTPTGPRDGYSSRYQFAVDGNPSDESAISNTWTTTIRPLGPLVLL